MCAIEWNREAATPPRMCGTSVRRGVVVALLYVAAAEVTPAAAAAPARWCLRRAAGWRQADTLTGVLAGVTAGVPVDAGELSVLPAAEVAAAALATGVVALLAVVAGVP